jgi:predicted amidohydrolase YtcJ
MVILDQNPLSIDPTKIATINVVETIKRDVSVYVAP